MNRENQKKFILEAKEAYFKIGFVSCPAFGGEKVYFKKDGWNHLLRKGRFFRDTEEQRKRLRLLRYAEYILVRTDKISEYKENNIDGYPAYFWSVIRYVDNMRIRVVIRKLGNGKKHFFSIMATK